MIYNVGNMFVLYSSARTSLLAPKEAGRNEHTAACFPPLLQSEYRQC